jgi:hypothetical protein
VPDDAPRCAQRADAGGTPDYLLVGTVTRDIIAGGFVPGGTVTYAGRTALALGARVAAVTSAGPDLALDELLPGVPTIVRPAPITTTFENVYQAGHRTQWLRGVAANLELALIPPAWRHAPVAHLAPLVNDVGLEVLAGLRGCDLVGITPQGWLREWDESGRVRRSALRHPESALELADAIVLSEEDVDHDWSLIQRWTRLAKLLVATQGDRGCTVFERGRRWQVPAFPVDEVDATGAGDVFAAAFFIRFRESGDPVAAARFANCVASFVVQVIGPNGIPSSAEIGRRLRSSPAQSVVAE